MKLLIYPKNKTIEKLKVIKKYRETTEHKRIRMSSIICKIIDEYVNSNRLLISRLDEYNNVLDEYTNIIGGITNDP